MRGHADAPRAVSRREERDGQRKIHPEQAAPEHRDDRARRPREDDADGGDHQGADEEGLREVPGVRPDRQGAGGAGARDHDRDRARGVRDGEPALRARRLPRPRGLHQEHDHGRGADGRRDPGGVGAGRPDAADARAHPAGPPGRHPGDRRVPEQGGHDREGGRGAARPGRAGAARAAVEVPVPGRHDADHARQRAEGAGGRRGRAGRAVGAEAAGRVRHVHPGAEARDRQAVPDAGGGRVHDLRPRHGGHGARGARDREGRRGDRDRRLPATP